MLRLQQGEVPTAIDMIQPAIANNANMASYDCNLAEALRLAGQLDEAAPTCERDVNLDKGGLIVGGS